MTQGLHARLYGSAADHCTPKLAYFNGLAIVVYGKSASLMMKTPLITPASMHTNGIFKG